MRLAFMLLALPRAESLQTVANGGVTTVATGIDNPYGILESSDGTELYVASEVDDGPIYTVTISDGSKNTNLKAASSGQFNGQPSGMDTDGVYLYVVEGYNGNKIRRMQISDGSITLIAGGSSGCTGSDFNWPTDLVYSSAGGAGTLYAVDYYCHKVRKIDIESGTVSILAGSGSEGSNDGAPQGSNRCWRGGGANGRVCGPCAHSHWRRGDVQKYVGARPQ